MDETNTAPQQPQNPMQQQPETKKSSGLALFIFAVLVLLVIALLWSQSKEKQEQAPIVPGEQQLLPQTNEEVTSELNTIEAELGEIDSETVIKAL